MVTEADWKNWKEEDFTAYLSIVFDAFGPRRVMIGSDWPSLSFVVLLPNSDDPLRRVRAGAEHREALHFNVLAGRAGHDLGRHGEPLLSPPLSLGDVFVNKYDYV